MADDLPPLDACGFVRVPADTELWMTCEQCSKSDHFWLEDDAVRCRCGARYTHAVRPDQTKVPRADLVFVEFDKGPKQLADLEIDPRRLGVVVGVVLGLIGLAAWWVFG